MHIQGHVFLVMVLLLIGATVLWIFISKVDTKWWTKALVTSLLLFAIASAWLGLQGIYGFPNKGHPNNEKYYLIGSYIEEPSAKRGIDGAIYLWLLPRETKDSPLTFLTKLGILLNDKIPRAYVVDYDKELHKALVQLNKQRGGSPIEVKIPKKKPKKEKSHRGDAVEERQKYVPFILPDSPLHGKDYGERPTPQDPTAGFSNTGGGQPRSTEPEVISPGEETTNDETSNIQTGGDPAQAMGFSATKPPSVGQVRGH